MSDGEDDDAIDPGLLAAGGAVDVDADDDAAVCGALFKVHRRLPDAALPAGLPGSQRPT